MTAPKSISYATLPVFWLGGVALLWALPIGRSSTAVVLSGKTGGTSHQSFILTSSSPHFVSVILCGAAIALGVYVAQTLARRVLNLRDAVVQLAIGLLGLALFLYATPLFFNGGPFRYAEYFELYELLNQHMVWQNTIALGLVFASLAYFVFALLHTSHHQRNAS
jgi:hypothetical protein